MTTGTVGARSRVVRRCVATLALLPLAPAALRAQAASDSVTLGALQRLAEAHDPRAAQPALFAQQHTLRRTTLDREWLPSLTGAASAQYLSDVASVAALPGRAPIGPPNDQVDAYVALRAPLHDPTRTARRAVEDARSDEAIAGVRVTLWQQRLAVHEAFFGALLRDAEARRLDAARADLAARRRVVGLRVDAGAALPGDLAVLDAEATRLAQTLTELRADAIALRGQLAALTGRPIDDATRLVVPRTADVDLPAPARDRPEFSRLARTRDRLEAQQAATATQRRPRLVLTSRTGYGRPGLNALQREYDTYWLAGIALEWTPFAWGARARDAEATALQLRITEREEASLAASIARAADRERATLAALVAGLAADDTVVTLRTRVADEARLRLDEGELSAADYVARRTELLQAAIDRDRRRLRIAEVRARYLTLIGHEVP